MDYCENRRDVKRCHLTDDSVDVVIVVAKFWTLAYVRLTICMFAVTETSGLIWLIFYRATATTAFSTKGEFFAKYTNKSPLFF